MAAAAHRLTMAVNIRLTYNLAHHMYCGRLCEKHFLTDSSRLQKHVNRSIKGRLFCSSSDSPVNYELLLRRRLRHESLQQKLAANETEEFFKLAMRKVPQQVVVVTGAIYQPGSRSWIKRGVTCSTFSSVSFRPPIISFCLNQGSRMHDLIKTTGIFAVHILAQNQVDQGIHFSKPAKDDICQFDSIPHIQGEEGLPIILGSLAVFLCDSHSYQGIGDHTVWYGNVAGVSVSETLQEPLIYFTRQFRSVGDEIFLKAFEDGTLPFENWTHEAHLRMAWNYINEYGKEAASQYIKLFIQKYNEKHRGKVRTLHMNSIKHRRKLKSSYHETITMFFIHLVSDAVVKSVNSNESFEEFLSCNKHLMDKNLILEYYSKETLFQEEARKRFISPDKKSLP